MNSLLRIRNPAEFKLQYKQELLNPRQFFAGMTVYIPEADQRTVDVIHECIKCQCRQKIQASQNGIFVLCCEEAVSHMRQSKRFPRASFPKIVYVAKQNQLEQMPPLRFLRDATATCYTDANISQLRCELDIGGIIGGLDQQLFIHMEDIPAVQDCVLGRFQALEEALNIECAAYLIKNQAELTDERAVLFNLVTDNNTILDRIWRFDVKCYNVSPVLIAEIVQNVGFQVCYQNRAICVAGAIHLEDPKERVTNIIGCLWKELQRHTHVSSARVCLQRCYAVLKGFRTSPIQPYSDIVNVIEFQVDDVRFGRLLEGLSIKGRRLQVTICE